MHPMGASETQRSNGSDIAQNAPRLEQADAEALIGDHGAETFGRARRRATFRAALLPSGQ
jgi:hypothetical protein